MSFIAYFAETYEHARDNFLDASRSLDAKIERHTHPYACDSSGNELTIDVARFGPDKASRLLILNSGTHGVEGFAGSGLQLFAMRRRLSQLSQPGVAIVFIHALNPCGFATLRRTTDDNIDLNRNAVDFSRPLPVNNGYASLHHALLPSEWTPNALEKANGKLGVFLAEYGPKAFQHALSAGQYDYPDGLFFGGRSKCWSLRMFEEIVMRHGRGAKEVFFLDIHTGLGPPGVGELMILSDDFSATSPLRSRLSNVAVLDDGDAASPPIQAHIGTALRQAFRGPLISLAVEYGTRPLDEMLSAMRCEAWHHVHEPGSSADTSAKQALRDAFYTRTANWCDQLIDRFASILEQMSTIAPYGDRY